LAAGRLAKASKQGQLVWADSQAFNFPAASDPLVPPANNQFLARATGGVILVTAVDGTGKATAGAKLAAGSGSWSTLSDRNLKANFVGVDSRDILQRLVALPVSTWNYQAQGPSVRHLGPTTQDFKA